MSTVFVVQRQERWDDVARKMVPRFDLAPAQVYGRLTFLLPPDATPMNPHACLTQLWQGLEDATKEDHLLLVGNPCLIGWAAAIFADVTRGRLNLLQWDGALRRYRRVSADVYDDAR